MAIDERQGGFLSRWARRKARAQPGPAVHEDPRAAPQVARVPSGSVSAAIAPLQAGAPPSVRDPGASAAVPGTDSPVTADPPPTLADVARLEHDSDYTRFVAQGVEPGVRNAALRKLFSDPRFNRMDGLDTYIDDYGKADPLPAGMLRRMTQARSLGLFSDDADGDAATERRAAAAAQPASERPPDALAEVQPHAPPLVKAARDEDADLRLQPDDDAGRAGTGPGAGEHPGRES